ncbi:hypothetical protein DL96DRAFT_1823709 [Flagelloscypha sp. PMI_526]|nr:hypothetical protein DL96DRAFT_1823709 [Flagelloscypha sp. PMI_526]
MVPDLPLDLVPHVLSFCDRRTLQNCSISGPDLYSITGELLYAKLTINEEFLTAILRAGTGSKISESFLCLRFAQEIATYTFYLKTNRLPQLVQILSALPNLLVFKLGTRYPTVDEISVINSLSVSPTFSFSWYIRAEIEDDDDYDTASGCSTLKDLCIAERDRWRAARTIHTDSPRLAERPALHSLRFEREPGNLPTFEAHFDITQLHRLSLWLGGRSGFQSRHTLDRILSLCADSLRTLSIFNSDVAKFSQKPLESAFPQLESLILWISDNHLPIRSWLTLMVVSILPKSINLRRICLYIQYVYDGDGASLLENHEELEELVKFLAQQKTITCLELCFYGHGDPECEDEALKLQAKIKDWLSKGSWTGLLRIFWQRNWQFRWPFWERDLPMFPHYLSGSESESD